MIENRRIFNRKWVYIQKFRARDNVPARTLRQEILYPPLPSMLLR